MFTRQRNLSVLSVCRASNIFYKAFCDKSIKTAPSEGFQNTFAKKTYGNKTEGNNYVLREVTRFITECAIISGCSKSNARTLACLLVATDCMGIKSEGLHRFEKYIVELQDGLINGKSEPKIHRQSTSTALVNGKNSLGHVTAKYAMNLAISKAQGHGAGLVACYNCNHYGAASLYSIQAIENKCIGLTFTSGTPLMVPPGGKHVAMGSNPFSIGGPGVTGDCFNIDMTTTATSLGKVEMKFDNDEDLPIGWAQKANGQPARDPLRVLNYDYPRLLPLGYPSFGHLGLGLALMVETMGGILAGSNFGPYIRKYGKDEVPEDVGYSFLAIDPSKFAPMFGNRLSGLLKEIRTLPSDSEGQPVIISGDTEINNYDTVLKTKFLSYNKRTIDTCGLLARELNVTCLRPKPYLN